MINMKNAISKMMESRGGRAIQERLQGWVGKGLKSVSI